MQNFILIPCLFEAQTQSMFPSTRHRNIPRHPRVKTACLPPQWCLASSSASAASTRFDCRSSATKETSVLCLPETKSHCQDRPVSHSHAVFPACQIGGSLLSHRPGYEAECRFGGSSTQRAGSWRYDHSRTTRGIVSTLGCRAKNQTLQSEKAPCPTSAADTAIHCTCRN